MAFVLQITRLFSTSLSRKGISSLHAPRHNRMIAGYVVPHVSSEASSLRLRLPRSPPRRWGEGAVTTHPSTCEAHPGTREREPRSRGPNSSNGPKNQQVGNWSRDTPIHRSGRLLEAA
jgi:hypothetical protein